MVLQRAACAFAIHMYAIAVIFNIFSRDWRPAL